MSTIYRPPPLTVSSVSSMGNGLKIATIIFGVIGFIGWALSIGFMLGWEYDVSVYDICESGGQAKITFGWYVSVPTYVAMIYVTSRIIFIITSRSFPSPGLLADLHESVARMVAFTVLNLTMWAMSLAWFVIDGCERNTVYYACNFGFLLSAIVAGLAGGLWRTTSVIFMDGAAKNNTLPPQPVPPPQPQTYHNQAYAHHPAHYR